MEQTLYQEKGGIRSGVAFPGKWQLFAHIPVDDFCESIKVSVPI